MPATLSAYSPPKPPTTGIYTAKDLLCHPEWGPCELIRGKVIPVCRPNYKHGRIVARLSYFLEGFVCDRELGSVVSGDSGVFLERDPDTLRGPDIYFVSTEKCPPESEMNGFLETTPDLCVEVVSPNDKPHERAEKIAQYFGIGVRLVWEIDPKLLIVRIYRLDGSTEVIDVKGVLDGEDVLPGFALPLADLFAALKSQLPPAN